MDGAQIPWRRIHDQNLAIIPERGASPRYFSNPEEK
jgi:hypothetical protein